MVESASCRPQALARRGAIRVDLCGCGQVHVTVGPITLRLAHADYLTFCDTLLAAIRELPPDTPRPMH